MAIILDAKRINCELKRKYATRKAAATAKSRQEKSNKRTLYIYKCDVCRYFHLTKLEPQK
jgi:hypothetical protein